MFIKKVSIYEWTTIMHNINGGHNQALLDKCRPLSEYSMLVMRIRDNRESMPLVEAVDEAVRYMINQNGVLSGVLSDNRSEVVNMIITEYNEELHMKSVYRDGVEEGIEKESKRIFLNMLSSGLNIEKAIEYAGITREQAEKIIAN